MFKATYHSAMRLAKIGVKVVKTKTASNPQQRQVAQRALALQFTDARGVMMKLGQLLAASANDESFDALVKGIPATPLTTLSPVIEDAIGAPIEQVFSHLDESTSAASLGQVHHGQLLNGEHVAVKVQYPDIAARVDAEIGLFGLMPGIGPVKKWGFDLAAYKTSFKANMDRELNYLSEAESQQRFREGVNVAGLTVPRIYPEYCSGKLLVQSWHEGSFIDDIGHWPSADRRRAGEIILGTLFKSLFDVGLVHGDPHLGNSYFRHDHNQQVEVVLMDYGCTIEMDKNQRLALLKLILATRENTPISPLRYFVALGFNAAKLAKIGDALPMLCRLLFKPFCQDQAFPTQTWQLEKPIQQLLNEQRWWFRSAGPAQLLLILRAFQGITQQLNALQTSVSWTKVLQQQLQPETIRQVREFELPPLAEEQSLCTPSVTSLANTLHVRVTKNGQRAVNVTLPAEMFLDIESLIPDDVLRLLTVDNKVDIAAIKQAVLDSGLAPQSVFSIHNGAKEYAVWLE
ncbi:hypothetical protein A9Q89_13300 [Gammaproteobacteria bacterium 53_120_T64]|nr:hypothetical protein A9Q89_13300 [Gammaproteobacteria bacterium 53_120_T64]